MYRPCHICVKCSCSAQEEDPASDAEEFQDDGGLTIEALKRRATQASLAEGTAPAEQASTTRLLLRMML